MIPLIIPHLFHDNDTDNDNDVLLYLFFPKQCSLMRNNIKLSSNFAEQHLDTSDFSNNKSDNKSKQSTW